ncbi:MAG: PH domain-containing protein [Propionibacteriaceae bacterium]|nr:PH domain-containing protein [Propionibacteriaceae bacterium]
MFGSLSRVIDPHVEKYLLVAEDEQIVDEVRRHPMAIFFPVLRLAGSALIFFTALLVDPRIGWVLIIASFVLAGRALWRILEEHMDRFVITNMRVFRVHGILSQNRATMPMSRILDITVEKPLVGRIFSYGHFVFESAAQDQGLRDIRYVGKPDERDLTIQTVIQRAGLRASAGHRPLEDDDT